MTVKHQVVGYRRQRLLSEAVLAVVDLEMSMAPSSKHTVDDVLQALYERCGGAAVRRSL